MEVRKIKDIWIEVEHTNPIGEQSETDDNTDVIVTFEDGASYVATFFTYDNIQSLRQKNQQTGECMHGKYFWASDMVLIDRISRTDIEAVIAYLLSEEEFEDTFIKQID